MGEGAFGGHSEGVAKMLMGESNMKNKEEFKGQDFEIGQDLETFQKFRIIRSMNT